MRVKVPTPYFTPRNPYATLFGTGLSYSKKYTNIVAAETYSNPTAPVHFKCTGAVASCKVLYVSCRWLIMPTENKQRKVS